MAVEEVPFVHAPVTDETPEANEAEAEALQPIDEIQEISAVEEAPFIEDPAYTKETPEAEAAPMVAEIQESPEETPFTPAVEQTLEAQAPTTIDRTGDTSLVEEVLLSEEMPIDALAVEALAADDTPIVQEVSKETPVAKRVSIAEETSEARELPADEEVLDPASDEKTQETAAVYPDLEGTSSVEEITGPATEADADAEAEPKPMDAEATVGELPIGEVDETLVANIEQVCGVEGDEEIPAVATIEENITIAEQPSIQDPPPYVEEEPITDPESTTQEAPTLEATAAEKTPVVGVVPAVEGATATASEMVITEDESKESEFAEEIVSSSDLKDAVMAEPVFESSMTGGAEAPEIEPQTERATTSVSRELSEIEEISVSTVVEEDTAPKVKCP